jgi:hypothetical protein
LGSHILEPVSLLTTHIQAVATIVGPLARQSWGSMAQNKNNPVPRR